MQASSRSAAIAVLASVLAGLAPTTSAAQVPDAWYAYGAFSPTRGRVGVFLSHPRTSATPTAITRLQGDLATTGASCIAYRKSDGALLVGERVPQNASLDLHVLHLEGSAVAFDQSFSLGTGGPCCGEIPQLGILSDDRVVVAVTDVSAGPLKNYQTTSYGWQGIGIVDTQSGLTTPIPITNGASIVDVFNGLAVAPDEQSVYVGTYVSQVQGDIWQVPIDGGAATLVASVPAGLSNLAFDGSGDLLVATLDANFGLYRVDLANKTVTHVPQSNGSLNALAYEAATGHFAATSATGGIPANSVFWMEASGTHHLLSNPGYAVLSGVTMNPNPEIIGDATADPETSYAFQMPNPTGLPQVGNAKFSLTLMATVANKARPGWVLVSSSALREPISVLGIDLHVDPLGVLVLPLPYHHTTMTLPFPIPNRTDLIGAKLAAQTVHVTSNPQQLAASPAVQFSVL